MKLTGVRAKNFKGRDFDYKLSGVTVFTGPNFSGKTAVLDAIRVGLIGYLPRLGKQPSATWKLAGAGEKMEVAIDTDTTTLSHIWRPTKTGASYDGSLPWATPTVLLDSREYFSMPTADRINYVFGLTDPAANGYTDADLIERLDALEVLPTKVSRPLVEQLVKTAKESISKRKESIPAWLSKFVDSLKSEQKWFSQQLKRSQAESTTVRSVSAGSAPVDVSKELGLATAQRDLFSAELAAAKSRAESEARATTRRAEIEAEIGKLPKEWSEIAVLKSQLEDVPKSKDADSLIATIQERERFVSAARADLQDSLDLQKQIGTALNCPKCGTPVFTDWITTTIAQRQHALQGEQESLEKAKAELEETRKIELESYKSTSQLSARLNLLRNQQQRLNQLRAELSGISVAVSEPVDLTKMQERLNVLNERASSLQLKQRDFDAAKQVETACADAERKTVQLSVSVELYKLAVKEVLALQEKLVSKAFGSLLEKARLFTDGILLSPLVYQDGEIGRMEGDRFVSWEVFSGCEEALALSGLSVALAQHAPCKVVVIDELGRLTSENKKLLLSRMVELVKAGHIDHFFGCDVDNEDLDVPGVEVVKI